MHENALAENYQTEARQELTASLVKVKHCLGQLSEDQVWQRPRPSMNSIGNLVLHLSGNLRQRVLSLIGGAADDRDRAREFAERGPIPKAALLLRLEEAVSGANAVLSGLTPARLLEERRYGALRGEMTGTVQAIVLRTLTHLSGHVQEIIYATRLMLGDTYRFRTPEPAAAPSPEQVIAADDVVFERGMIPPLPAEPQPATDAGTAPSESPLRDHLLALEQEFQDQEEKGKL